MNWTRHNGVPREWLARPAIAGDLAPLSVNAILWEMPANDPCGWFIVETEKDGFATLHGPYWEREKLAEKYESLFYMGHFGDSSHLNVIPVEGIKPA